MSRVKTFNLIKNAAWSCVLNRESEQVQKEDQMVNLVLLRDLMHELNAFIKFYQLKGTYEKLVAAPSKAHELDNADAQEASSSDAEDKYCRHILKRFTVFGPYTLKSTIKKCEALGLLIN